MRSRHGSARLGSLSTVLHERSWRELLPCAAEPCAFAGGLIYTGRLRAQIGLLRQSLDLGGKWHPVLHRSRSLMSRAVLGNERGGDGGAGAERCTPGSSRGRRSEAAPSCRRGRGLCSHLVSAGRRNLERVWEAVVVQRGRVMLCFQVGAGRGEKG